MVTWLVPLYIEIGPYTENIHKIYWGDPQRNEEQLIEEDYYYFFVCVCNNTIEIDLYLALKKMNPVYTG